VEAFGVLVSFWVGGHKVDKDTKRERDTRLSLVGFSLSMRVLALMKMRWHTGQDENKRYLNFDRLKHLNSACHKKKTDFAM
jgi:hypothetical protein